MPSQIVPIVVVVDGEYDWVDEDQQDDEAVKRGRLSEVDQLFSEGSLEVEQIEGPVVIDNHLLLRSWPFLRKAALADVGLIHLENALNEVGRGVDPLVLNSL